MKFNAKRWKLLLLDNIILMLLLIVIIGMWIVKPAFMTFNNWLNIFKSIALRGVIAFGMTMIIISAQIDLSVGSIVAIAGVVVAWCCKFMPGLMGISLALACLIGIVLAILCAIVVGLFHGYMQHKFTMPAFIVTLATQLLLYGIAGIICGGFPIADAYPDSFNLIGTGKIGSVPVPAIILLAVYIITLFFIKYTNIGRSVYAVGGNEEAARLSGINVMFTKIFCFVITALLATLSGFMNSAQVRSGTFSFGRGWELDVIASVVIGGTSMTGGIGTITGTLLGALFLGVIFNGMTLLDVSLYMQYVIRGVLLFGSVLLSIFLPKFKQKLI